MLVSTALNNIQRGRGRWFFDAFRLLGQFTDQRFYGDYDRDPRSVRAGSNDSEMDDFVPGISNEMRFELSMKYRLGMGKIGNEPVSVYRRHERLLESEPTGGERWNPVQRGETTFGSSFFHTYRDLRDFTVATPEEEVSVWAMFAQPCPRQGY